MNQNTPQHITTLRGHDIGVTALTHFISHPDEAILVSGDEKGAIIFWDFRIYRKLIGYANLSNSRIQSLKIVAFKLNQNLHERQILIVQTRDDDVKLISLQDLYLKPDNLKILQCYSTCSSLFSRGDAVTCSDNETALLAYPSCLNNFLVTVRLIGYDGETHISGTAQRFCDNEKTCTIFDICLEKICDTLYYIIVGYEDGQVSLFNLSPLNTKTVPELATKGLKIDLLKTINLGVNDFVSAIHATFENNQLKGVFGSPLDELVFMYDNPKESEPPNLIKVTMKRPGVASIKIRPDKKLVAVGTWDASVIIYSMKSRKFLASLHHQTKQVSSIEFVEKPSGVQGGSNPNDNENISKYLLCCASMGGTISIVSIY